MAPSCRDHGRAARQTGGLRDRGGSRGRARVLSADGGKGGGRGAPCSGRSRGQGRRQGRRRMGAGAREVGGGARDTCARGTRPHGGSSR